MRTSLDRRLGRPSPKSKSTSIKTYGGPQSRGIFVKEFYEVYKKNYCVKTCVDAIAADVSKDGHRWVRNDEYEATPEQEQLRIIAEKMISQPNPNMSEKDLFQQNAVDILIGADAFVEVVYKKVMQGLQVVRRVPAQFWPIEGATMRIDPENQTGKLPEPPKAAYLQKVGTSADVKFDRDQVVHISEGNLSGRLYGTPRLLSAVLLIATQHSALLYNMRTFTGGKYPRAFVNVGMLQNEGDLDRLIEKAQQQADDDPHGLIFLEAQALNLLKLIDSNRDMEFMDLVKFVERSICAVYRVPPIRIGIAEAGGAGIVVGATQMATYWDNVEEVQRNIAEQYNLFFFRKLGLKAWKLELVSGRPELYNEQAVIEDYRIKNGSLTINEARMDHGLDPVRWGDDPPPTVLPGAAAPMQFSQQNAEGGLSYPSSQIMWPQKGDMGSSDSFKSVAPGRMQDSPLTDQDAQKEQQQTRSRVAGAWMRARKRILQKLAEYDAITTKRLSDDRIKSYVSKLPQGKARLGTLEEVMAEMDRILGDWEKEEDAILQEGLAGSYSRGRDDMRADLEVEDEVPAFTESDAERLAFINDEFARRPIRTFRGEQLSLIRETISEAHVAGEASTYEIRGRIEQNFRQFSDEETWKLDRIVRTSIHQANSAARGAALRDSGVREVRFITANDGRVRATHKARHNEIIPIEDALDLLNDINCRCHMIKPSKRPKTVPDPDAIADEVKLEQRERTRQAALASLEEAG